MLNGIDVSHHQSTPSLVPWAGHDFAIVRITWGISGVDALAGEHLRRAQKAGCELAVYHFQKDQPGDAQAEHFHRQRVKLKGAFGPLACANDLEDMPGAPWDEVTYQECTAAFVGRHRQIVDRPLVLYGNPGDIARFAVADRVDECPLWIAHWNVPAPFVPLPWKRWAIWQRGVVDKIDRNVFDGSREDWRRLFLPDATAMSEEGREQLGHVVQATRLASGTGDSVEAFITTDEGPVIDSDPTPVSG